MTKRKSNRYCTSKGIHLPASLLVRVHPAGQSWLYNQHSAISTKNKFSPRGVVCQARNRLWELMPRFPSE